MGPVRLGVGTEWLLDGRVWRVVRQLASDRFVAQDSKFHTEREFSQEEVLSHYASGQLRFAGADASASDHKTGLVERYPQIRKLVDNAIQTVYLTKARRPISAVTRRVFEDLQRLNARLPAAQAIPVPRQSTLGRAIARRISRLDPWEVDRERWGRKIADRRHAPISPQRLATRILQRVEIDHSPLKVVVGIDAGPIGQPWLPA